jgi:hypothetical protein
MEVSNSLRQTVRTREGAARRAEQEAERSLRSALDDFDDRWEADARSVSREMARLDYGPRHDAERALDQERERSRSLVERRLRTSERTESIEDLVDRLVAEGIERAERSISGAE